MTTVMRFDRAELSTRAPRTDQWQNLIVDAVVCVPGVYPYRQPDGTTRRELKPPEEIFAADHMESVRLAVVTDEHLPGAAPVTPQNARQFQRGSGFEAKRSADDKLIAALKVTDGELISSITSGAKKGVSLGLKCRIDRTPGIWRGVDGKGPPQQYDVVQRDMVTNQISVTARPRIPDAEIRMDSDDAVMVVDPPNEGQQAMNTMQLTVGDSTVAVEAGAGSIIQSRLTTLDSTVGDLKSQVATLTKERDGALAERDTAREELAAAQKLATDSDDIPKLYAKRRRLLADAAVILTADALTKVDDASDLDVRKAAITEAYGESALVGDAGEPRSVDYIEARFDSLVAERKKANGGQLANALAAPAGVHPGGVPAPEGGALAGKAKQFQDALARLDSLHTENRGGMRAD